MCTLEKHANVYILTITGTYEHRLHPNLLDSISAALHRISSEISTTSLPTALITTAQGNYFCNGGDLAWVQSDKMKSLLMLQKMRSLYMDIMSLPMPTIASLNGHACGGGFLLALCHDYIFMRKDRGYLFMPEQDHGRVLAFPYVTTMVKAKISNPAVWRDVILKGEKMTAEMAVKKGIIDAACRNTEETVARAVARAVAFGEELVKRKWNGNAYAENRKILFGDITSALNIDETEEGLAAFGLLHLTNGKTESRL